MVGGGYKTGPLVTAIAFSEIEPKMKINLQLILERKNENKKVNKLR